MLQSSIPISIPITLFETPMSVESGKQDPKMDISWELNIIKHHEISWESLEPWNPTSESRRRTAPSSLPRQICPLRPSEKPVLGNFGSLMMFNDV